MLNRRLPDIGLLSQEVTRLAKQRRLRIKYRPADPGVEVIQARWRITADELSAIGWLLGERLQQVALALPPSPVDDGQRAAR